MQTYQVYRNGRLTGHMMSPTTAPLWPGTPLNDGLLDLAAGVPVALQAEEEFDTLPVPGPEE